MRIHHLNCGSFCPLGGRLFDGRSDSPRAHLVCHCLLIETADSLVLVDTGYGMRDVRYPGDRLAPFFRMLNDPQLRPEQTAIEQVRALGFSPRDVRHIVLTHLDFDHAGGLEDFPHARVHVSAIERDDAQARNGGSFIGRRRYRPVQWDEGVDFATYPQARGDAWFGFDAVRDLQGLGADILLVPLAGHSAGHCGVAVRDGGGWLLHAGDAYFHRGEVGGDVRECSPGLRGYQRLLEVDRGQRVANQARLRALARDRDGDVRLFCAHDPVEFEMLCAYRREGC